MHTNKDVTLSFVETHKTPRTTSCLICTFSVVIKSHFSVFKGQQTAVFSKKKKV